MHVSTYLNFSGRCEEAFRLYERVTRGKIVAMVTYGETPCATQMPSEWQKKIVHARLQVGSAYLMGCDAPPDRQKPSQGYAVSLGVDTPEDAERIYKELSDGGEVHMPLDQTFFARKFAMFTDKFGIPWMVICENRDAGEQTTARTEREKVA